ncbi:helix-turn-helix transcriptional regulator [Mycobacteroides abscessus subsp. abscessus]|uniref:helix-turn-helix domain-containing protein n=1 Tax=Mycobacteroides abscessus TaxID=36809 RepID=UPI0009A82254|nr:helix-turn-helix transcriptional regulator [Mycobacteroides abscessus]QSM92996.1 helix-turn-helix transcriptional regulator [Mycobacteroides abscessus subsp. abscessus]QSM98034.1 helix-turn-helix transcriptional regulator [Mycobacteroides abscessus subsp. abscessus]
MPDHGDTNAVVGTNVKRLRAERRWSLRELSERLPEGPGWMAYSGVRAVESNKKAVTVDALSALATAFEVSPLTLLMPHVPADEGLQVSLTGTPTVEVRGLYAWLRGEAPIHMEEHEDEFLVESFRRRALPPWAWSR